MSLLNHNLQAFLAIYEKSTVSAAAESLGLGQTAITQRIRSLEQDLGITLFTRSRKGMLLTAEGKLLLKYCLRSRELEGETLSELKHAGLKNQLEVRIAGPTSFLSARVVPQLKHFFEKYPAVNLQFTIDDRPNRIDLIKQGQADIVVLHPHQVPNELDSKVVKPDEYILVATPKWKNRDLSDILQKERLFAFHAEDNTSLNYLKSFDLLKHLKQPRQFANENLALAKLLQYGVGFGILSKEVASPYLEDKSLIKLNQGRSLKDPLALAWYPRHEMAPYFKDIISAIK